jgi:hypothetical protein
MCHKNGKKECDISLLFRIGLYSQKLPLAVNGKLKGTGV